MFGELLLGVIGGLIVVVGVAMLVWAIAIFKTYK